MKKRYIAYGSNMDEGQMAYRCPTARLLGQAEQKIVQKQLEGAAVVIGQPAVFGKQLQLVLCDVEKPLVFGKRLHIAIHRNAVVDQIAHRHVKGIGNCVHILQRRVFGGAGENLVEGSDGDAGALRKVLGVHFLFPLQIRQFFHHGHRGPPVEFCHSLTECGKILSASKQILEKTLTTIRKYTILICVAHRAQDADAAQAVMCGMRRAAGTSGRNDRGGRLPGNCILAHFLKKV